ncbi:MAG TPA: M20 family metallopeptidase [Bacillota bacterium]
MDVIEILQQLIRIPSLSGQEKEVADFLRAKLETFADQVRVDDMNNVIAEIKGKGDGPVIMFNGHIDVAPVGDMEEPFSGKIIESDFCGTPGPVVYGRGACDNKGAVSAMLVAAEELAKERNFRGKLILTFVAMEEAGGAIGTKKVLDENKLTADILILGEATNLDIYLGHRGKVEFILETIGRSAHASNPGNGVNALLLMNEFINAWQKVPLPAHETLGQCTTAITKITVPDPGRTAIIPNSAVMNFDCRYLPEETPESVRARVERVLEECAAKNKDFRYKLDVFYYMPPFYTSKENPFIAPLQEAIRAHWKEPKFGAWLFGGDGTFVVNEYGIPTIGFGPAHEEFAHSCRDHVAVRDVKIAKEVYKDFVLNASVNNGNS